jgi:hypothetical protein
MTRVISDAIARGIALLPEDAYEAVTGALQSREVSARLKDEPDGVVIFLVPSREGGQTFVAGRAGAANN